MEWNGVSKKFFVSASRAIRQSVAHVFLLGGCFYFIWLGYSRIG